MPRPIRAHCLCVVVASRGPNATAARLPTKTHRRAAMGAGRHRRRDEAPRAADDETRAPASGQRGGWCAHNRPARMHFTPVVKVLWRRIKVTAACGTRGALTTAPRGEAAAVDRTGSGRPKTQEGGQEGCSRGHINLNTSAYLNGSPGTSLRCNVTVSLHQVNRNAYPSIDNCHPTLS